MKTEKEQLDYINRTCNTDYKSMEEVDWDCISMCHKLSEDFIREFKDKVDWLWISTNQLSENFIREFQDYVYWVQISMYQKLSEDFIREFKDKVDWGFIFDYQTLSEDFIQEFKELMIEDNDKQYTTHTETVSVEALESKDDKNMEDNISKTLTEQEKLKYINRTCNTDYKSMEEVDWGEISVYKKLTEDFIREFKNNVDWCFISINQTLSEKFIREFKDNVNWEYISRHQKLSEDFIREFSDKVYWTYISKYQKLSEDFMDEFADKLNWILIPIYQNYSDEFAKKNRYRIKTNYNGPFCLDKPKEFECLPESNTEFNININKPKKIILTEPTEPLEEDPLQLKTRNIKLYENELLEVLKNPQLPTLITNIQDLELLLQKIDKQINENNFYHIEVKWTGDGITDGESNNDIFDLDTGIFTEKELKEYMQYLRSFYEKKLNKLKYQYLNIFNGVKYRNLITE